MSAPPAAVIEDFRPYVRNTLRGFCRVRFPSGIILHDVTVHRKESRCWASPPGRPTLDRDGALARDQVTGKIRYAPTIGFADRRAQDRFSDSVIEALRYLHPDALDEEGAS